MTHNNKSGAFKLRTLCFALLGSLTLCSQMTLAATAEDAAKLSKNLTPFGAERAGNADGSIPAWDGGSDRKSVV